MVKPNYDPADDEFTYNLSSGDLGIPESLLSPKSKKEPKPKAEPKEKKKAQPKGEPKFSKGDKVSTCFLPDGFEGKVMEVEVAHDVVTTTSGNKTSSKSTPFYNYKIQKEEGGYSWVKQKNLKLQEPNGNIRKLSPSLEVIKKYAGWNGAEKSREQIEAFLKQVQKYATDRLVKKGDRYEAEYNSIQRHLMELRNKLNPSQKVVMKLHADQAAHFAEILGTKHIFLCTKFANQIIGMQGKPATEQSVKSAKALIAKIESEMHILRSEKPYEQFLPIFKKLKSFTTAGATEMKFTKVELNGFSEQTEKKKKTEEMKFGFVKLY